MPSYLATTVIHVRYYYNCNARRDHLLVIIVVRICRSTKFSFAITDKLYIVHISNFIYLYGNSSLLVSFIAKFTNIGIEPVPSRPPHFFSRIFGQGTTRHSFNERPYTLVRFDNKKNNDYHPRYFCEHRALENDRSSLCSSRSTEAFTFSLVNVHSV